VASVGTVLTGAGELHLEALVGDNVLLTVTATGNARQLGYNADERWIDLGWWAPLVLFVDPDSVERWMRGRSRFLEFLETCDAIPELWPTNGGFQGIQYDFKPGVSVTLWT
jgi:hypothetical protein